MLGISFPSKSLPYGLLAALCCCLPVAAEESTRRERPKKKPEEPKEEEIKPDVDRHGFSRAPYVQMANANSIRMIWRTVRDLKPEVRIGPTPASLNRRISGAAIQEKRLPKEKLKNKDAAKMEQKPLHSAPKKTVQFETTIEGLAPDSKYYYAIYDGERRLTPADSTYYFRTTPPVGSARSATFWVVGDSGTAERRQEQVYEGFLSYLAHTSQPVDFYLHVGDMAYSSGKDDQFTKGFFRIYENTLRNTVVWPAIGNHEGTTAIGEYGVGPYFDAYISPTRGECGGLASGTEAYYSWEYGKTHFIALDSFDLDRSAEAPMAQWLKEDLARTKADWVVCYFHHPPYTKGSHDSDKEKESVEMRENILPILENGGVDVVFTGHSHIYERSMLIDGAYSTPTRAENVVYDDGDGDPDGDGPYKKIPGLNPHQGSVHVVAGHGGAGLGRKGTLPIMRRVIVEHGSVLVTVKDNTFTAIMINHQGDVRDQWQIMKTPGIVPKRIAQPRELPPYVKPGADMPAHYADVMPRGAEWKYLAGSDPAATWKDPGFDDKDWKKGKAGFGYGDKDDNTELEDMDGNYKRVYVRREFEMEKEDDPKKMGLAIRYDDAFIAYLNGKEFLRVGIEKGAGADAEEIGDHEADADFEYFSFEKAAGMLKEGKNLLAIEGHTINSDEGDFTLDPFVVAVVEQPRNLADRNTRRVGQTAMFIPVLPLNSPWHYSLEDDPGSNWFAPSFDDQAWRIGVSGFGYGTDLGAYINTDTEDGMKDKARVLYTRTKFKLASKADAENIGLSLTWDDGVIVYLNGKEVIREGVMRGAGKTASRMVYTKDPRRGYFPFKDFASDLKVGENLIAIEGHNYTSDSNDFAVIPTIIRPWGRMAGEREPAHYSHVIPKDESWEYLAGREPSPDWTVNLANAEGWKFGFLPIGYGADGLETKLDKMRSAYQRVYVRHEFQIAKEEDKKHLGILLEWNDAFIAYLNGKEIYRVGVESGNGAEARGIHRVSPTRPVLTRYLPFKSKPRDSKDTTPSQAEIDFEPYLKIGTNIIAIEGHNYDVKSDNFVLGPKLIREREPAKREDLPVGFTPIIPSGSLWQYREGGGQPDPSWKTTMQASGPQWKLGKVPLGYKESAGSIELGTRLEDMRKFHTAVQMRASFDLKTKDDIKNLGLAMRWDDGFIAWLNGKEILRENVSEGEGETATGVAKVDPAKVQVFPLASFAEHFRLGENIIAIEGHNESKDSSDFHLDPYLIRKESTEMPKDYTNLIAAGETWEYWASAKEPGEHWEAANFLAKDWKLGKAPIGYDNEKDPSKAYKNATELSEMRNTHSKVFLRRKFAVSEADLARPGLGLAIRFDDAFIAYLNGEEVLKVGFDKDGGVVNNEAKALPDFFTLDRFRQLLKPGENILAIEARNDKSDSSDFTIDPMLIRPISVKNR